jgi:hypothetical protein
MKTCTVIALVHCKDIPVVIIISWHFISWVSMNLCCSNTQEFTSTFHRPKCFYMIEQRTKDIMANREYMHAISEPNSAGVAILLIIVCYQLNCLVDIHCYFYITHDTALLILTYTHAKHNP